ncbi:MAG: hypothetical protein NC121_18045 [Blautia sp.]|nr:hypothetical protein [Blautia sp.]
MERPDYILKFNDGLLAPWKESAWKDIVRILVWIFWVFFLIALILWGFDVFREIPVMTWVCLLSAMGYLRSQGGSVRKPSPCELWFYDDHMVQYCERRYYSKNNIRREYYKFYYKDITRCVYRTVVQKFCIYGMVEAAFYKYDKKGNVDMKSCKRRKAESISVFYTVFEPDIDFVKEIETHAPIRVEYENS